MGVGVPETASDSDISDLASDKVRTLRTNAKKLITTYIDTENTKFNF